MTYRQQHPGARWRSHVQLVAEERRERLHARAEEECAAKGCTLVQGMYGPICSRCGVAWPSYFLPTEQTTRRGTH